MIVSKRTLSHVATNKTARKTKVNKKAALEY